MNEVELKDEMNKLYILLERKERKWDHTKPYEEYQEYIRPEYKKINELGRQLRMIKSYKLTELSDFGDVMSLEHFIDCVDCGGFIDYDGDRIVGPYSDPSNTIYAFIPPANPTLRNSELLSKLERLFSKKKS